MSIDKSSVPLIISPLFYSSSPISITASNCRNFNRCPLHFLLHHHDHRDDSRHRHGRRQHMWLARYNSGRLSYNGSLYSLRCLGRAPRRSADRSTCLSDSFDMRSSSSSVLSSHRGVSSSDTLYVVSRICRQTAEDGTRVW